VVNMQKAIVRMRMRKQEVSVVVDASVVVVVDAVAEEGDAGKTWISPREITLLNFGKIQFFVFIFVVQPKCSFDKRRL